MRKRSAKCVVSLFLLLSAGYAAAQTAFPLTVAALQQRFADEVTAHSKYNAYAEQACSEGYPNIAHLFKGLAASEAIHARNFKRLLTDLGAGADMPAASAGSEMADTRRNLKHAAEVEREEIDNEYPGILERIEPEHHDTAIANITYAWKAEQQHRDLIVKLQKSAIRWFGMVVKRIEGEESHVHVCNVCGSTLRELPAGICPICGQPASHYREVPPLPTGACEAPPTENGPDL
jgi:rubrerythrin